MVETSDKHEHLEWAIKARAKNQACCLRLLRLFDDNPGFWRQKKASRAAQELVAVAFSLWRAAFLAEKTGKREQVLKHGRDFLERLIEDNAIAYPQDKSAREWTFNYYTRHAGYSLEFLGEYWPDYLSQYQKGTRTAVERWDYCQTILDDAVDGFEKLLSERRAVRQARRKVLEVRKAAKERKSKSRAVTLKARSSSPRA